MKAIRALLAIPEALNPTPQPGIAVIPANLSPMTNATFMFSPMGITVNYFGAPKYSLWIGELNSPSEEIKSLPNAYRRDLVISLSSFAAARHLAEAELPVAIRSFMAAHAANLKKPFLSYDCKGGQSADVSDMFSSDDQGPKNTRF